MVRFWYPYSLFQSAIFTAICIAQSASANHGLVYTSVQLCLLVIFTQGFAYINNNVTCTLITLFDDSMYIFVHICCTM
jgi:hypothetical protein